MKVAFDAFASPAQIGEIHRLGLDHLMMTNEQTDELILWAMKKYPRDLTGQEAAELIENWPDILPETPVTTFRLMRGGKR